MSSDKEQFMELGEESEDLGAIHEEDGAPEAIRRIQSSQTEQRIIRKPGDSAAEYIKDKQFSQTRLDQLFARWDNGAEAFWISYQERCEIVYEIQKETAKPGCKGEFSNALRRIHLSDSTAYDMIKRHRIRIGEIPDPDAPDPREEEEENSRTAAGAEPEDGDDLPEPTPRQKPAPRVVLVLKDKSGPSQRKKAKPQSKPLRLDAREQASMVKAQLAINNVVAALKNNGDWQSALAEYDKVAVAPGKLDSFVNRLNPDPDWKAILIELVAVLEQHGEKLPVPVLNKKRTVEKLLDGKDLSLPDRTDRVMPAKRYHKIGKLDEEGNRRWSVMTEGEKKASGIFETDSEADEAIANLNSPVTSLMDIGAGPKMLPASVTPVGGGCLDLHEGVA
jgi:hypothetical protein